MSLGCSTSARIQNIARGILPTAASWGTAPTSLANCTDGDPTTVTGTGSTTKGGADTIGIVTIDLGAPHTVLLGAKVGMWVNASIVNVYLQSSLDGATWANNLQGSPVAESSNALAEALKTCQGTITYARYVRSFFWIAAAGTANVKIYELWALRVV